MVAVMVISVLCAVGYLGSLVPSHGATVADLALGLAAGLAPLPVLLGVVLAVDQLAQKPRLHLAFAFAWGAGTALVASVVVTGWLAPDGLAVLTPAVEEVAKGAVLGWLLWRRKGAITTLTDGIVYAAMAGLGFATVESAGHHLAVFARGGQGDLLHAFVQHGLGSGIAHPLWSALLGLGVGYAAVSRTRTSVLIVPLYGAAAVLLHSLWNHAILSAPTGHAPVAGERAVSVACAAAVIVLAGAITAEHRGLVAAIGRHLPRYQPTGLVTPRDIAMLSSPHGRWQALHHARRLGAGPAMAAYQRAATELVLLSRQAERGAAPPGDQVAERLAAMSQARAALRAAAL